MTGAAIASPTPRLVRDHLARFEWDDAERLARRFLLDQPESADGHFLLGETLRERWQLTDARTAFDRAIALDRGHAEAWAGLGFVRIVCGAVDEGLAHCRWASRLRSDLPSAHRYIASGLTLAGRPNDAARSALEARRLAPHLPENNIVLASTWMRAGLAAGARRLLDRTIAAHPGRAEAFVTRAALEIGAGQTDAAMADLERGLALKPWLPPAHSLVARCHAMNGRWPDARAALERARQGHPFSEEYLLLELDWLAHERKFAEALAQLDAERWRHPRSRDLAVRSATWRLATGQIDEARAAVPGTLATDGANEVWRRLADYWLEVGPENVPQALMCLQAIGASPAGSHDAATRYLAAELNARLGRHDEALRLLDGLTTSAASALAADLLQRADKTDEAAAVLTAAVERDRNDAFCIMRLGMLKRATKDPASAERHLRRAAEIAPTEAAVWEQLAILLSDQGALDEAVDAFRRAAERAADHAAVRLNLGLLHARQKRWADAEQVFARLVHEDPANVQAIFRLAQVLGELRRWHEAAEMYELAIERMPDHEAARLGLLGALRAVHQIDAAAAAARQWVADVPASAAAVAALARQLAAQGHPDADATADRAWAMDPESANAYDMRADVANSLGRYREALDWLDRGMAKFPDNVAMVNNRGLIGQEIDLAEAAVAQARRVVDLVPDAKGARMNLALALLRHGNLHEGWTYYESRDTALHGETALLDARARAGGALDLSQSTVLVRAEQGLGDTLQFMRYVKRLARDAREVFFHLQDGLTWTARHLAPNVRVYGYQDRAPRADYQTALISLPAYYGTTVETIAGDVPYVAADPGRAAAWRARIGDAGFRVGLVWHTNPAHGNARRWIPLRHVAPLAELPGVRLISLQKFHGLDQLAALPASQRVETLGERFDEGPDAFADAAAVISHLHLVVTIDTSMAHLAGAMGCPVAILLHKGSDWRWMLGRQDSPWYPSARLFRQAVSDEWQPVSDAIVAYVKTLLP